MNTTTFPASEAATLAAVVANNVRALMATRGVSQMRLAAAMGLSQTAVSKRLRTITPFDTDDLDRLSDLFDVPAAELVTPRVTHGYLAMAA